jgi:hypothetical protein
VTGPCSSPIRSPPSVGRWPLPSCRPRREGPWPGTHRDPTLFPPTCGGHRSRSPFCLKSRRRGELHAGTPLLVVETATTLFRQPDASLPAATPVRLHHRAGRLGLEEGLRQASAASVAGAEHLQRDEAIGLELACPIDDAHAAVAQDAENLIAGHLLGPWRGAGRRSRGVRNGASVSSISRTSGCRRWGQAVEHGTDLHSGAAILLSRVPNSHTRVCGSRPWRSCTPPLLAYS